MSEKNKPISKGTDTIEKRTADGVRIAWSRRRENYRGGGVYYGTERFGFDPIASICGRVSRQVKRTERFGFDPVASICERVSR